ncbi:hypothetical protein ACWZHB_03460 [Nocardia sp. FBN12]
MVTTIPDRSAPLVHAVTKGTSNAAAAINPTTRRVDARRRRPE